MAVAQTGFVPVSYSEVTSAPASGPEANGMETALAAIANTARALNAIEPLATHPGLADVARAHALDMAVRGYVGYADPSGLSLLDQVRLSERSALIGSFGSSIVVLDASASAKQVHDALQSDPANAANLRRNFSHVGIGAHVSGDRLYVVQLFARIDGVLDKPLPVRLTEATVIRPSLVASDMTPVGWSLSDASGEVLARGSGRRIQSSRNEPLQGYLNLDVAVGTDVYTLRGPYIQVSK